MLEQCCISNFTYHLIRKFLWLKVLWKINNFGIYFNPFISLPKRLWKLLCMNDRDTTFFNNVLQLPTIFTFTSSTFFTNFWCTQSSKYIVISNWFMIVFEESVPFVNCSFMQTRHANSLLEHFYHIRALNTFFRQNLMYILWSSL